MVSYNTSVIFLQDIFSFVASAYHYTKVCS